MEEGGEHRRERRDSDSSTDSWSVIDRRNSSSSSVILSETEMVLHEDERDEFSDSDSDISEVNSDIELEDDVITDEESEGESVEEVESEDDEIEEEEEVVVEEEETEGEEEIVEEEEEEDSESEFVESEEEEEEEDNEEEEEEDDDDQLSVVDENEAMQDEAAQYVSADKINKSFDALASHLDSPFDRFIGGDRGRACFILSLLIASSIGVSIGHIIGASWIASAPKAYMVHQFQDTLLSPPVWSGLQSRVAKRRHSRVNVEEVRDFLRRYSLSEMPIINRLPSNDYGNCSLPVEVRKEQWRMRERREVRQIIGSNKTSSMQQCSIRAESVPRSIHPMKFSASPSRLIGPSFDLPPPQFNQSPHPSAYKKSFCPTTPRAITPSIQSPLLPIFVAPPPSVTFKHRKYIKTTSGTCRRPLSSSSLHSNTPKVVRSVQPPPPLTKKYQHFTKSTEGIHRRSSIKQQSPMRMGAQNQPKTSGFIAKLRPSSQCKGPVAPPKVNVHNSMNQWTKNAVSRRQQPCVFHKPCSSQKHFPIQKWSNTSRNFRQNINVKTSLLVRSNTSISLTFRKNFPLRKTGSTTCVSQHTNSSDIGRLKGKKSYLNKRRTVSTALRRDLQQCDKRQWKQQIKPRQLRLPGVRAPQIAYKKPVPCRENNGLDEQLPKRNQRVSFKGRK